jgi:hypothetical protein
MARRNDDGTVSAASVDTPESAASFLSGEGQAETTVNAAGTGVNRKAASNK